MSMGFTHSECIQLGSILATPLVMVQHPKDGVITPVDRLPAEWCRLLEVIGAKPIKPSGHHSLGYVLDFASAITLASIRNQDRVAMATLVKNIASARRGNWYPSISLMKESFNSQLPTGACHK